MSHSEKQWNSALDKNQKVFCDVIASTDEASINYFLSKHYDIDNDKYTYTLIKSFDDGGVARNFKISISAKVPVRVNIAPFSGESPSLERLFIGSGGWNDVPSVQYPVTVRAPAQPANVRVSCERIDFHIEWPNLTAGQPAWTWDITGISAVAEGYLQLNADDDGHYLTITPTRIKFDKEAMVDRVLSAKPAGVPVDDRKFTDLLVISMNVVAEQYGPKLVQNVNVPILTIGKNSLSPSFLDISEKTIVVGAAMNIKAIADTARSVFDKTVESYKLILKSDIEKFNLGNRKDSYTEAELDEIFSNSRTFLSQLRQRSVEARSNTHAAGAPELPDGLAIGLSQYFLEKCADNYIGLNKSLHGEETIIPLALKGGYDVWCDINNPNVTISGTSVSGSVNVDVGGDLFACVRKAWDCSWKWDCDLKLALWVTGTPKITLHLQPGNGISFYAHLDSDQVSFGNNLPWPFDKVIDAFLDELVRGISGIANIFASLVKFDILLPQIGLPEQKSKISFQTMSPFSFQRTTPNPAVTPDRKIFIGYSTGMTVTA